MTGAGAAVSRAIAALLFTAAVVVGVPYLLVTVVGNPFPSTVPTLDEVRILLTQNGQGFTNFLIGSLAVIIWFIWFQLMVALVVEVVATIQQRETRRLPTAPGIQALAARLVATITLATALAAGPMLAPAVGALQLGEMPLTQTSSQLVDGASQDSIAPPVNQQRTNFTTGSAKSAPLQAASTVVVVAEQTELWDLADAAYGDGISWKLIAQANAGVEDAAGVFITPTTEVVASGTEIIMPGAVDTTAMAAFGKVAVAADSDALADGTRNGAGAPMNRLSAHGDAPSDGVHKVEPGDSMWSVAQDQVESGLDRQATDAEVADYWVDVVAANEHVASGNVDLIYPGETIVMPGAGSAYPAAGAAFDPALGEPMPAAPAQTFERTPSAADVLADLPSGLLESWSEPVPEIVGRGRSDQNVESETKSAPTVRDVIAAGDATDSSDDNRSTPAPAIGLAALGAAMLSAGILGAVRRRRDFQRRTRPQGTIAREPSSEAAAFEAALAYAADEVIESKKGAGWTMLSIDAVAAMRLAGPVYIHAEESGRLRAVAVKPPGHVEPKDFDLEETVEVRTQVSAPEPTVDTPGLAAPSSRISVAPTSLLVGTDVATGEAVLLDLESAVRVELKGDHAGVRRFARTAVLDLGVSDRAEDLCVIAIGVGSEIGALERVRNADSFRLALDEVVRCGHAVPGATTPVVVISTVPAGADADSVDALTALGAAVVAPEIEGSVSISIQDRHARLMPSGMQVELVALDDNNYRNTAELVEATSAQALELVDEAVDLDTVLDVAPKDACSVDAGPIEVKVLGPVEVAGADSFSSLKAVDVVAYLAFHRHGVDADQIKAWVWPTFEPPTDKALANVLSRARTGLGVDPDGVPFLSRAGADKTYRLADAVTTDFDRFRAIVELADAAPDDAAALGRLQEAIELIRGVPFSGGAASSFAWADNHVRAQVEYTIDETVHRAADLALDLGDFKTARWAALKGLELVPGCEQCFRRRFLVASASKNRSELQRAMADLERSAAADLGEPEAVDWISGDLLDLYHELDQALVAGAS